jgi:glutamate dehydrogenase/leucine dehydrogenase
MNPTDLLPTEFANLEDDPILDSTAQLENAARSLDLEDRILHRLKHPEREVSLNLPLDLDSGDSLTSTAALVQYSRARGPCFAPVLLSPDVHLAQLRSLALHVTLQCALLDLPIGGGAGSIVCDPAQLSESELRHLVNEYLWALRDIAGPHSVIFAPAEYAAAWTHRLLQPATVVGKPPALGGIPDQPMAIAQGWFTLITEGANLRQLAVPGCRIALQGLAPAAAALARLLTEAGARIVALADKSGGLFADRGLDIPRVCDHVQRHGVLYGFTDAEPVRNADVLESACDVLITAAAERQVNAQNAARIRAPLVLEAVYSAVTPTAAAILHSRGFTVVSSLLGSAPATLAGFVEWQHAILFSTLEQSQVESTIRRQLSATFHRAQSAAVQQKSALPDACYMLALEQIAAALRLSG